MHAYAIIHMRDFFVHCLSRPVLPEPALCTYSMHAVCMYVCVCRHMQPCLSWRNSVDSLAYGTEFLGFPFYYYDIR